MKVYYRTLQKLMLACERVVYLPVDENEVSLSFDQHCVLTDWDALDAQNGNNLRVYRPIEDISKAENDEYKINANTR